MNVMPLKEATPAFLVDRQDLQALFDALLRRKYRLVGPLLREGAITYGELRSVADLPAGWTDEQDGGTYRLKRRQDEALFGYAVGPHSWKQFLFPPALRLWTAERDGEGFHLTEQTDDVPAFAFLGVRACELHAIAIQDRTFIEARHPDSTYEQRRRSAFIIAVNCGTAGGTCFCVSMHTGPQATFGYDLALTELIDADRHVFLVQPGSERGEELMPEVPHRAATAAERAAAVEVVAHTAGQMGRHMDTSDIKDLLYRNYQNPRWDDVAGRCLSCGNCTMVCPTCFCSTVEDTSDLSGDRAERRRLWDSCFTAEHSFIHGGSVRPSTRSRYRQWMTHKLATWIDQFGTSGCVGCGRCITWCPVAIDITEEVSAIRASETRGKGDGD